MNRVKFSIESHTLESTKGPKARLDHYENKDKTELQ